MKRFLFVTAMAISLGGGARLYADDAPGAPDELFKKLDTNGDGKLTASEIPQQHRKFFERLLRIGDADKNGELTRAEFDHAFKQNDEPVTDISKVGNLGGGPPAKKGNFDPKQIFQALDKNKDGKLTRDEASGRPRILAIFDRLGKDEIVLDDLSSMSNQAKTKKKKRPVAVSAETTETNGAMEMSEGKNGQPPAIFILLDTNHDGKLSQEELSKAGALFEKLDRNHDGFVDAKELLSPAPKEEVAATTVRPGKKGKRAGGGIMQRLMRADANGDGKISEEEAPPQLKKHFAKLDTNGDGFLDKTEIETWLKHRQKRLGATTESDTPAPQPTTKTPAPSGT